MSAAENLAARLAQAARATAERRGTLAALASHSVVAVVDETGLLVCRKPWAVDEDGWPSQLCEGRLAHHRGPCGPRSAEASS